MEEWISVKEKLPDSMQSCDWLFPPTGLKLVGLTQTDKL